MWMMGAVVEARVAAASTQSRVCDQPVMMSACDDLHEGDLLQLSILQCLFYHLV